MPFKMEMKNKFLLIPPFGLLRDHVDVEDWDHVKVVSPIEMISNKGMGWTYLISIHPSLDVYLLTKELNRIRPTITIEMLLEWFS